MLRDRLVYNINVSEQFDEYDLKEVFQLFFVEEWENTGDNGDIDCMV